MSAWMLLLLLACGGPAPDAGHGHSHGPDGGHGDAGHGADATTVVLTRWTETHELFVELDAPVAGTELVYRAHITRREDNVPAQGGVMTLRFEQDGFAVEAHTDSQVARPGLFSGTATSPAEAGNYQVIFSFTEGDDTVQWGAGQVQVAASEAVSVAQPAGEIGFTKESQWQVPFASALAEQRAMSPTLSAPGMVRGAPSDTAIVAAPVEGLVAWSDALPVVGRTVRKGERLATLIPAGAAAHWAELQAAVATQRARAGLAEKDLVRVQQMHAQALVSDKRLDEAHAAHEQARAALQAAERQVSGLTSGSSGAVSIRAPSEGLIIAVGAGHGEAVSAGTPLVTVSAGNAVLIDGHVHDRGQALGSEVTALSVFRGDWTAPRDVLAEGGQLLTERLVYDAVHLSAPLIVQVPGSIGLSPGDLVTVEVSSGDGDPRLAVPRGSVVELNGQDVVFVQTGGETFTRRLVKLGVRDASHVEVLHGLTEGERVVAVGGFDVHVAALAGALESHRH